MEHDAFNQEVQYKAKIYPLVHPSRSIKLGSHLMQIEKGDGIYIRDTDGRTYIDGISGLWNVSLGYNHPEINRSIIEQLEKVPFVNLFNSGNPTSLSFAEKLVQINHENLCKVVYTCTGSESIELAIKICRKYYKLKGKDRKIKIATLDISYHGTYYGSMSASGMDREVFQEYGPMPSGFIYIPSPLCKCPEKKRTDKECVDKNIQIIEQIFEENGEQLAGIILEPIIGSGGIIPLPQEYLERIKELCHIHDVLLVMDEVATGFGRTGKMFAYEHYGIIPDVLCLSKGINSGYLPLGAVLFNNRINEVFSRSDSFIEHLSTQNGNPVACAAGIATLDIIHKENLIAHVNKIGEFLKSELSRVLKEHVNVLEIRGMGLMLGIELVKNKGTKESIDFDDLIRLQDKIRQKGLIIYPFYIPNLLTGISLFPPYYIDENNVHKITMILKHVMERCSFS